MWYIHKWYNLRNNFNKDHLIKIGLQKLNQIRNEYFYFEPFKFVYKTKSSVKYY